MMTEYHIDLIVFAAIALFFGWRLWLLLGTHEAERPLRKRETPHDDVITSHRRKNKSKATPVDDNIIFVQNFEAIVRAYGDGDLKVLREELDRPLFETFEDSIKKRGDAGHTLEVDINRVMHPEILDEWQEDKHQFKTVRFTSQQCLVTRDRRGQVLSGNPDRYMEVTDIWTFARPLKGYTWKLMATQIPEDEA